MKLNSLVDISSSRCSLCLFYSYLLSQKQKCLPKYIFMPCPFTRPKMFWAGPIFCARQKIYLHIVAVTNILCQTKR